MSSNDTTRHRRVLLVPSAGMGHLIPLVRLATALSARNISISLLSIHPTVSAAESGLLSSLPPSLLLLPFPLAPLDPSLFPPSTDPFVLQMEAIRRSAHLLPPLLSPFSSLIVDISLASSFLPVASAANIPSYVFHISSASMLALCSISPFLSLPTETSVEIAHNIAPIPNSSLPPFLHYPNLLFAKQFVENGRALVAAKGVIVNTFSAFEKEILDAFNNGKVVPGFPPVIDVGPLVPTREQACLPSEALRWLDKQAEKSVLYVGFGNRTAMSREQIRELGDGLEMSGWRFLWVVKSAKVDREERVEIGELLGEEYVRRVGERGLVVKEWVEQEVILGHFAVGGFLSHSGWNSVTEAAAAGVRMLAWPRNGDQRVTAPVVVRSGLGVWPEEWAWEVDEGVVSAEEICGKVREVMGNERLAETAAKVGAEARKAVEEGGSSEMSYGYLLKNL